MSIQQYDDHAARTEAAFNAFARVYSLTTPPPKPPRARRSVNWTMVGLVVVTVAAVLVSGDRTIDEFGGWPRGVVAFVMLEVTAIVFSFILTKLMPDGAHSKKLIWVALFFVLAIMVGANIHSIGRLTGMYISPAILTAILMLVAISAPVLTAINGHLTAVEWKLNKRTFQLEMNEYEGRLGRWRTGLNAEWERKQGRGAYSTGIKVEREPVSSPIVPMERPLEREGQGSGKGFQRNPTATEIVEQHLADHPEDLEMDPRDLARQLNVGKSTAYAVVGRMKEQKGNDNVG